MNWTSFDSVALFGLLVLLSKRAVWGPQRQFARLSLASLVAGGALVFGPLDIDSLVILYLGGPVLFAGLVLTGAMLLVDIRHMWRGPENIKPKGKPR